MLEYYNKGVKVIRTKPIR